AAGSVAGGWCACGSLVVGTVFAQVPPLGVPAARGIRPDLTGSCRGRCECAAIAVTLGGDGASRSAYVARCELNGPRPHSPSVRCCRRVYRGRAEHLGVCTY